MHCRAYSSASIPVGRDTFGRNVESTYFGFGSAFGVLDLGFGDLRFAGVVDFTGDSCEERGDELVDDCAKGGRVMLVSGSTLTLKGAIACSCGRWGMSWRWLNSIGL